jgi:hypothetical protein
MIESCITQSLLLSADNVVACNKMDMEMWAKELSAH